MTEITNKDITRSWLYGILAKLEMAEDVDCSKVDSGRTTVVSINWEPVRNE